MRTRITSAIFVAVVVLALTTALFNGAPGADATQGQPIIAGQENTATNLTYVRNTGASSCPGPIAPLAGLAACGNLALLGYGTNTGVDADGGQYGVHGRSHGTGTGVRGQGGAIGVSGSGAAIGVSGTGSDGVYGEGTENGVHAQGGTFGVFADGEDYGVYSRGPNYGVFGQASSPTGIGVAAAAEAPSGTALSVEGKARFSRSGTAKVAGTAASPKSSVVVTGVALTAKSLVLMTPQKNVAGVWVRAAVPNPAKNQFTVFLNKGVSVGFPVAWMVIERP